MQMECALIAVNVVMAGCFTSSSLRKQALAFPVMGSIRQMGSAVLSGMH